MNRFVKGNELIVNESQQQPIAHMTRDEMRVVSCVLYFVTRCTRTRNLKKVRFSFDVCFSCSHFFSLSPAFFSFPYSLSFLFPLSNAAMTQTTAIQQPLLETMQPCIRADTHSHQELTSARDSLSSPFLPDPTEKLKLDALVERFEMQGTQPSTFQVPNKQQQHHHHAALLTILLL